MNLFPAKLFSLSGPAAEEGLCDMEPMRRFVEINLGKKCVPDETADCTFHRLC